MHKIKKPFYFLIIVMLSIPAIGYAQEALEQSEVEPDVFQTLIRPALIALAVVLLLTAIVYIIFRTVQQWKTMHHTIISLPNSMQSVQNTENYTTNSLKQIEIGQNTIQSNQEKIEDSLHATNRKIDNIIRSIEKSQESNVEKVIEPVDESVSRDYQREAEREIQDAEQKVLKLQDEYKDGQSIYLDSPEKITQSQEVLISLNWIEYNLRNWISELDESGSANTDLIQRLKNANQDVRNKLKEIRGEEHPTPRPLEPAGNVENETEFHELQIKCNSHVAHFEGMLYGYELQCQLDKENYDDFIPQFIKDSLFNGVAKYLDTEQPPELLCKFLAIADYEIIPLEIGKTVADAHYHDIQQTRQTSGEQGTILEVIIPGLQRISDGEIVQKPVVVRGE